MKGNAVVAIGVGRGGVGRDNGPRYQTWCHLVIRREGSGGRRTRAHAGKVLRRREGGESGEFARDDTLGVGAPGGVLGFAAAGSV